MPIISLSRRTLDAWALLRMAWHICMDGWMYACYQDSLGVVASLRFDSVRLAWQRKKQARPSGLSFSQLPGTCCVCVPKNARAYFFMSVFAAHACLHCTRISITSCETRYADVNPLSKWARKVPLHLSNIYSFLQGTREFNKKPLNILLIQHFNWKIYYLYYRIGI